MEQTTNIVKIIDNINFDPMLDPVTKKDKKTIYYHISPEFLNKLPQFAIKLFYKIHFIFLALPFIYAILAFILADFFNLTKMLDCIFLIEPPLIILFSISIFINVDNNVSETRAIKFNKNNNNLVNWYPGNKEKDDNYTNINAVIEKIFNKSNIISIKNKNILSVNYGMLESGDLEYYTTDQNGTSDIHNIGYSIFNFDLTIPEFMIIKNNRNIDFQNKQLPILFNTKTDLDDSMKIFISKSEDESIILSAFEKTDFFLSINNIIQNNNQINMLYFYDNKIVVVFENSINADFNSVADLSLRSERQYKNRFYTTMSIVEAIN